jgi:hypothetical protein
LYPGSANNPSGNISLGTLSLSYQNLPVQKSNSLIESHLKNELDFHHPNYQLWPQGKNGMMCLASSHPRMAVLPNYGVRKKF